MQRERGKSEQQRRRRGLAGLPVPPKSWDYLLLQSTVAQQKQREQQNYTHLPSAAPPTLAHVDYNCASSHPTTTNARAVEKLLLKKAKKFTISVACNQSAHKTSLQVPKKKNLIYDITKRSDQPQH